MQVLGDLEGDAKPLRKYEEKRKYRRSIGSEVQGVENKPRRKDELRSLEMAKAEGGATRIAPANVPSRFCPL